MTDLTDQEVQRLANHAASCIIQGRELATAVQRLIHERQEAAARAQKAEAELEAGGAEWSRMASEHDGLIGERDALAVRLASAEAKLRVVEDAARAVLTSPGVSPFLDQALNQLEAALNGDVCQECKDFIHWIDCPTGGWWAHITHPADNHDAVRMT